MFLNVTILSLVVSSFFSFLFFFNSAFTWYYCFFHPSLQCICVPFSVCHSSVCFLPFVVLFNPFLRLLNFSSVYSLPFLAFVSSIRLWTECKRFASTYVVVSSMLMMMITMTRECTMRINNTHHHHHHCAAYHVHMSEWTDGQTTQK